jgi:DNA-binding NarL/FixJ family response regulator
VGVTVVVGEDSVLVREGIATLVAPSPDIEVLALCADRDELDSAIDTHTPDVVVTDIRMPPSGTDEGIQLAERLRETSPGTGVVVLSQYAEPAYARDLFRSGSEGRAYLLKERLSDARQLTNAIVEVANGGSVVDPRIVDALVQGRPDGEERVVDKLSPREQEVLAQIAEGKNNAAVAEALILSERAVEKHISSLFGKLGLVDDSSTHRRVKAVLMYLSDEG